MVSCNEVVKEKPNNVPMASDNELNKLPKPLGAFKDASIGCAMQDKAGNLWFGTNGEGLFRYDGKTFTKFTEKDGLDHHLIYSLMQDETGNIWVGTKTGLCRYNGKTFTKVLLTTRDENNMLTAIKDSKTKALFNGVWSMMSDKKGTIWFGADDGVYCYDGSKPAAGELNGEVRGFTCFLDNPNIVNKDSLHLKSIFSFLEDKKGNILFASCIGEGLMRFDGKTLQRISPKGYARTESLVEDKDGTIWFSSIGKGICKYDGKTISTSLFFEKKTDTCLYLILKDKQERLWFSEPSNKMALRYYNGNEIISFEEKAKLPNKNLHPILEDKSGNIWFASRGMGLYKWDGKSFSNFSE
jgi:ligand-binding sensor domain-containing protein